MALNLTDLLLVQPTRSIFTIACDERDCVSVVQQLGNRVNLIRHQSQLFDHRF